MRRKVVQQGPATLMVSIPSKWARENGLKKGDEIDLEQSEGSITLRTKRKKSLNKTSIDLKHYGRIASRSIGALYKQGYDEIEIVFRTAKDLDIVNKNLNEFIGFEMVSQTKKGCMIKEISAPNEESFDLILNRTILLLKSVAEDTYTALKSNDRQLLQALPKRDTTINKYANYCRRIINKHGYKDHNKTPMIYYLLEELENLGDEYKYLVEFTLDNNYKLDTTQLTLLNSINDMLDQLYHLILKFDVKKADSLSISYYEFSTKIKRLEKTKEVKKPRVLDSLSGMSRIMMNMLGPLLTMELR